MASIFGGLAGALAQRLEGQLQGQQTAASLGMNALAFQNNLRKTEAEIEKDQADTALTRHKNLSPVFGEGDAYNQAKFGEASAEGYGKLGSAIAEARAKGDIDTANKLLTMGVQQGYDLTKLDHESSLALGRQMQQQGFRINQEIPTQANANYTNERALLAPRLQGELRNRLEGTTFENQFSIPGRLMQSIGAAPKPTPMVPQAPAAQGSPNAPPAQNVTDPVLAQRQHWDAAASSIQSGNPNADPTQVLGPRP